MQFKRAPTYVFKDIMYSIVYELLQFNKKCILNISVYFSYNYELFDKPAENKTISFSSLVYFNPHYN